ncbi:MAG TPA: substrate-binding domain-containing protein [Desulfosalsimonadaceae bacterium]|nr:substrate-binding domain-containing protein [Desulfosalsimonadaceae bacterium]
MKLKFLAAVASLVLACLLLFGPLPPAAAEGDFQFSCSNQIYQAFGEEMFHAFTEETGLEADIYKCASDTAMKRLMNDSTDLASSTKKLYYRHQDYGYNEIVFAKDPLALITNTKVKVDSLSSKQIREIFSGDIKNWVELGGNSNRIVTMAPGQHTGAYWNFRTKFMDGKDIRYDFMSYDSTMVIRSAKHYPYVISFVTRAAISDYEHIKVLNVDGASPDSDSYPYYQTFAFVTKGEPEGPPKAFIDFVTKGRGKKILEKKGVTMMVNKN